MLEPPSDAKNARSRMGTVSTLHSCCKNTNPGRTMRKSPLTVLINFRLSVMPQESFARATKSDDNAAIASLAARFGAALKDGGIEIWLEAVSMARDRSANSVGADVSNAENAGAVWEIRVMLCSLSKLAGSAARSDSIKLASSVHSSTGVVLSLSLLLLLSLPLLLLSLPLLLLLSDLFPRW